MTPEEWRQVKEAFQSAIDMDAHQRADFLNFTCARGSSVRSEVDSLLRSYDEDKSFLEQKIEIDPASLLDAAPKTSWAGRRVGPYELLEEIGEGGMGAVYRGVRADGMYDKQVAIKLIRGGLTSDFFVSRFRNERQILAGLEHPNIARLLDGGVTEEGLPYVVLEFVAGTPIDEYCIRHDLPIADRLGLFRTVCSAVQYAHQNLVVHRDLKPGNILVTEDGIPKLLDFGIAKILVPQQENGDDRTLTMMRIMTPDFASPEQVRGEPITTASDIYSLGVILYVLLAGRRPYHITTSAPLDIMRAICDTDPEKPSTAVTRSRQQEEAAKTDSIASPAIAGPSLGLEKLRRALAGDLDNIVLKALRKEPARRYTTVEQFSEDIRRHLEHLPVIARKDTAGYLASKFILRHRFGVAITAIVSLLMSGALTIAVVEARRARAERTRAEARFNDVRSLANSLIFDVHDSIKDLPGSTPARKIIVDRALRYLNSLARESSDDFGLQRELATAYERVGQVQGHTGHDNLGDPAGSLASYQKALAIRKQIAAKSQDWKDRLALARAYRSVSELQGSTGNPQESRADLDLAITACETLNQTHPSEPEILREMATAYRDSGSSRVYPEPPDAEAKRTEALHKALAADEAVLRIEPDDLSTQSAYAADLSHIGGVLQAADPQAAVPYYRRELQIIQQVSQASTAVGYGRRVALAYRDLSSAYEDLGDFPRAVEYNLKALKVLQQLSQADAQNASVKHSLAIAYTNTAEGFAEIGNMKLALEYSEKATEIMHKLVSAAPENRGERHYLASVTASEGTVLMQARRLQAALARFEEARAIYQSFRDAGVASMFEIANVAACTEKMGEASALSGNDRDAASYLHQALTIVEPLLSANSVEQNPLYAAADAYSALGDMNLRKARLSGKPIARQRANWTAARAWYAKSLETWRRVEHPDRFAPATNIAATNPKIVAKKLQQCDSALSRLRQYHWESGK